MAFFLAARRNGGWPLNNDTQQINGFISGHLEDYLRSANYELSVFLYAQKCSTYEGAKIYIANVVNIKNTFGNNLCRVVSLLLNVKRRIKTKHLRAKLQQTLTGVATNQEELSARIRQEITGPAGMFKIVLSQCTNADDLIDRFRPHGGISIRTVEYLRPFFGLLSWQLRIRSR